MPDDDFRQRIADLARQDAGHAILSVAFIDQILESLILLHLPSTERAKKLVTHRAPLGSLPNRSQFVHALNLIDDATFYDIKAIQRVRNAFAHPDGFRHFKSEAVAELFQKIEHWPNTDDHRALFDERVTKTAATLTAKVEERAALTRQRSRPT